MEMYTVGWGLAALLGAAAVGAQAPVASSKYCVFEMERGSIDEALAERFTREATTAIDTAAAAAEKLLQTKFSKKPRVVVHCEEKAYRDVEKTASKLPFLVDEFEAADGSEVHVLLRPSLGAAIAAIVGLPEPTRQGVVLSTLRALALRHLDHARKDPWLAGVFAMGVLDTITNPKAQWGIDPAYDERRHYHRYWLRRGTRFDLYTLLQTPQTPGDASKLRSVRCEQAVLAQFLAKENGAWARRLFDPPENKNSVEWQRRQIVDVIVKDLHKAEPRWDAFLKTLAPRWSSFDGHAKPTEKGLSIAGGTNVTVLWGDTVPSAGPYTIRGGVTLAAVGKPEIAFGVDATEAGAPYVVLAPGKCDVVDLVQGVRQPKSRLTVEAPVEIDVPFQLEIRVSDVVVVLIGGKEIGRTAIPARIADSYWSVSIRNGIATLDNLRLETPEPAKK